MQSATCMQFASEENAGAEQATSAMGMNVFEVSSIAKSFH